jgi:hypothetical protein
MQTSNTWSIVASMPAGRGGVVAAPMPTARAAVRATTGPDGCLYAIGGRTKNAKGLHTVEAYSTF